MSDDEQPTFESTESGASLVFPQTPGFAQASVRTAGELRKGSMLMIKGHPCKVSDISTSKTGKHGHAKAHIVAINIFTGKKSEYQLLTADADTGEVSLLLENGELKDDLNLPTFVSIGEPTDGDKELVKEILAAQEEGKIIIAAVLAAMGMEKLVGMKIKDD